MKTNRRNLLHLGLGATIVPLTGCSALGAGKKGFIDAHVHVWTDDTDRWPIAEGFKKSDMQPPRFNAEDLLAEAQPNGVDRIVLIQMSFYKTDNRYMLAAIRRRPNTFRGVAIIDPDSADPAAQMKALKEQGVRGFRLYTDRAKAEAWLDSPSMRRMWTTGADEGMAMCLLANPDALPAVRRMCTEYPRTPVVIDHFARIGMKDDVNQADLDLLRALSDFEHIHVKTSAFYALGKKQAPYTDLGPMIRQLRDSYGAKRLMWATDCPYQVGDGHTYHDSIALIRDRLDFLTPEDKDWMLRGTAERVFFG